MIGTRLTEVHQDADAVRSWLDSSLHGADTSMIVRDHVAARTFFGGTGMIFVSGGDRHVRLSLAGLQPVASRTYDDDIRAQVSVLWAEDWDSEEDSVYDQDEW